MNKINDLCVHKNGNRNKDCVKCQYYIECLKEGSSSVIKNSIYEDERSFKKLLSTFKCGEFKNRDIVFELCKDMKGQEFVKRHILNNFPKLKYDLFEPDCIYAYFVNDYSYLTSEDCTEIFNTETQFRLSYHVSCHVHSKVYTILEQEDVKEYVKFVNSLSKYRVENWSRYSDDIIRFLNEPC